MATNTNGGTTASLSNTPQAKADTFYKNEDLTGIALLDVMLNDLAGNAKILWSVDDSATDAAGATDLIGTDIGKIESTTTDTSAHGAKIWIQDGKVAYQADTLSAAFKASLQALAVGETATDSFTYAIRMSNGTLSWNTATIVFTGTNDGPDISVGSGDSASETLSETDAALSTSGTLTVVDPDTSDTVAVSITGFAKGGNAGSLTDAQLEAMLTLTESSLAANSGDAGNLHWSFNSGAVNFNYLAAGEWLTLSYTVTADDGHGGTDTQTVTITVEGTNDGPAIVSGGTLNGDVEEESGTYTASGSFGFTDVDSSDAHTVSVTPAESGYLGTLTPSVSDDSTGDGAGTVSWSYSVSNADLQFLGEGETRTQTYTVTVDDGHGGTASETVTVILTGDNDPVVITSAAQSESVSEDGTSVAGTITFNDVDLSDTHTAGFVAAGTNTTSLGTFSIDPSVTEAANAANGSLGWSYTVNNAAAQYLAAGESAVEQYDVTFSDGHGGTVTETVTVTITGANDAPDIRAIVGDSTGHGFNESDVGLSVAGTLTVTDPDTSDMVDTSATIAVSGNQGPLSDGDLLAMFSITAGANNLAADTGDTNNLSWSFDSGSEAFDFLAEGDILTLTYTLTSDDGNGGTDTQDVTITVTGSNDIPVLTASVTSGSYTDTAADDSFANIAGNLTTVDPDTGDTATYSVSDGVTDFSLLGYDTSSTTTWGTLYLNSTTGAYTFVPNDTAIEALKADSDIGFTFTVTDSQGATANAVLMIHIDGTNDTPELSATLTSHTYVDTAADDSFASVGGSLSSTDRDSPETATYGVVGGGADNSLAGYDTSASNAYGKLYVNSLTGGYTFVPNDGVIEALKTDTSVGFTLTVTDGSGATDSETLTINLDGANDTPELGTVTDASYNDTAGNDVFGNVTGALTSTDRDLPETATYGVAGGAASVEPGFDLEVPSAYGTFYLNSLTGDYKFVPNDGAIEGLKATTSVDFNVSVTDGSSASDGDTLTITLNGVNDTPDAPATNSVTTDEDNASSAVAIGATDRDVGEVLTYSVKPGLGPSIGTVSFNQVAGTFTYAPDSNANGPDSFTILITDASGATTEQLVSVTVNPVNDAPVANADLGSAGENENKAFAVVANDTDVDDGAVLSLVSLDGVTVDGDPATLAEAGAFSISGNSIQFTPGTAFDHLADGATATVVVSYTIEDEHGAPASSTLTLTLTGTNDGPVANADLGSAGENETKAFAVLANDTDVDDGAALSVLSIDGIMVDGVPANAEEMAAFSIVGNQIQFTPGTAFDHLAQGANANVVVSYTIEDEHGAQSSSTLTLTVNGADDDVQAPTDIKFNLASTVGGLTGGSLALSATLGSFTAADADSSSWTFTLSGTNAGYFQLTPATGNSVTLQVASSLPAPLTNLPTGTYTFNVTATDGGGNSYVETFNVSVGSSGTDGAVLFTVSNNSDLSFGLNGGDTINGGNGEDALVGGNGTDALNGGLGNDELFGGAQTDSFIFNTAIGPVANVDDILDFDAAGGQADKIHLDDAIFSGLTAANLAANFQSSATGAFSGTAKLQYNSTTGELWYDADGAAGPAAAVLFAQLTVINGTVDAGDFAVI